MKRTINYLLVAALVALPLASSAQITRSQAVTLLANNNVSATSYTYGFFRGPDDDNALPLGPGVKYPSKVKTGATTVDVTSCVASSDALLPVGAGDLLIFPNAPTVINSGPSGVNVQGKTQYQERVVVTDTDANNVVVNSAVLLNQDNTNCYVYYWKKAKTGTGAEDGKFDVSGYSGVQITEQVTAIAATSIDFSFECRLHGTPNSQWEVIEAYSFTATGVHNVYLNVPRDECRLGIKVTGDAGTQAAWAYVIGEKFSGR